MHVCASYQSQTSFRLERLVVPSDESVSKTWMRFLQSLSVPVHHVSFPLMESYYDHVIC